MQLKTCLRQRQVLQNDKGKELNKAANPFRLAALLFAARNVYFLLGGKSVQLPCAISAAMPMLSPSLGCR